MLLQFVVSNYKSIGHNIEFSMFPMRSSNDERFLTPLETRNGTWRILRRGGIFGPNASGKSSFIKAIDFARDFIIEGQKSGKGIRIDQFRGDIKELEGLSSFQFVFYLKEEIYEYGFSLDRTQVHEEWLMKLDPENGFQPLFTRATNSHGKTHIDIEPELTQNNEFAMALVNVLKTGMKENQKNQLFLYKLYDNGIPVAEEIFEWFKNIQIIFPDSKIRVLPIQIKNNENLRSFIGKMLSKMDTGVFDISVASEEIDFNEFVENFRLPLELLEEIEENRNGILSFGGKCFIFAEDMQQKTVLMQLKFSHKLNGEAIQFDFDDESDGTQRLLDLLPMLFVMQEDCRAIYLVDEIDRSLHTKLTQYFLNEFIHCCKNTQNQIIFTAHDVNLINLENFRQEEIWFVEKNNSGESRLKPLSDFQLLENQDTLKAYLSGRFGAIPTLRRDC